MRIRRIGPLYNGLEPFRPLVPTEGRPTAGGTTTDREGRAGRESDRGRRCIAGAPNCPGNDGQTEGGAMIRTSQPDDAYAIAGVPGAPGASKARRLRRTPLQRRAEAVKQGRWSRTIRLAGSSTARRGAA